MKPSSQHEGAKSHKINYKRIADSLLGEVITDSMIQEILSQYQKVFLISTNQTHLKHLLTENWMKKLGILLTLFRHLSQGKI